jgi:hypothetical protein
MAPMLTRVDLPSDRPARMICDRCGAAPASHLLWVEYRRTGETALRTLDIGACDDCVVGGVKFLWTARRAMTFSGPTPSIVHVAKVVAAPAF